MSGVPNNPLRLDRRHPVARRIIAAWRGHLTELGGDSGGEPTLIACSGGADSVALALAIASTGTPPTLAFARHDARPAAEVEADRSVVLAVAKATGSDMVTLDCVTTGGQAPTEATMRKDRYAALAAEARRRQIRFVATGHHADDQLETVLLALIRGSGPSGMAGMAPARPIDSQKPVVHLIRPMLGICRADAERVCLDAGLSRPGSGGFCWAEDKTNSDPVYLRNRVRHEVVPMLDALNPGLAERVALNAEWFRQTADIVRSLAIDLDGAASESGAQWSRDQLAQAEPVVVGELLRWCIESGFDRKGLDRLTGSALRQITDAIRDNSTEPRRFEPGDGVVIEITARAVSLSRKNPAEAGLEKRS